MKSEVACSGNDHLRFNQVRPSWRIECGGKSEWCNQTSGIIYIHTFNPCNASLLNISKYAKELLFIEGLYWRWLSGINIWHISCLKNVNIWYLILVNNLHLRSQLGEFQGPRQQSWDLQVSVSPSALCLGSVCSRSLAFGSSPIESYHSLGGCLGNCSGTVPGWLTLWLGFLSKQKSWGGRAPLLGLRSFQVPLPSRLGELGTNHNASESLLSPLARSMHLNI